MKKINQFFSGITTNTLLLAFASLFTDISTEMLYPILPIFLTNVLLVNGSIVGLIEGIAQATQNITQGFSGQIADRFKKRKMVALIGYLLAALAKPLIGLSTIWPHVLGARFLDRLGTGIRSAPRDALIAASVTKENRGKAFGLEGIGDNLGAFLGPIITILVLALFTNHLRNIFYLTLIPGLLAFLLVLFVKEKKIVENEEYSVSVKQFPSIYWRYVLVTALFAIGNSTNAFFILKLNAAGASLNFVILTYAFFNLTAAVSAYPSGMLSDRFGRKLFLLMAFFIFFITYVSTAFVNNKLLIAAILIVYGLYQGIFRAVGKAYVTDLVPEALYASGIGWYSACLGLLQLIASIIAGIMWDHIGHAAVFIYGASSAILGIIALIWLMPTISTDNSDPLVN